MNTDFELTLCRERLLGHRIRWLDTKTPAGRGIVTRVDRPILPDGKVGVVIAYSGPDECCMTRASEVEPDFG